MADRTDPSQYTFTAGDPNFSDFTPDTAGTPNQAQAAPEGVYATAEDMAYPDHSNPTDPLSVRPADTYTRGATTTRETGQPFPFAGSAPLYFQDGYLAGYSFRETTGAAGAAVEFRDAADPSGKLILTAAVPAGGSAAGWFLPGGILFSRGLYALVVSGSVTGSALVSRDLIL